MELVLCLCFLLGTTLCAGTGAESFIDEPPANILAIQGDTVLLRCGVDQHVTATLSWQDMDTQKLLTNGSIIDPALHYDTSTRARLSLIGDRAYGEYHLEIRNVVGTDGGRYACYYKDAQTQTDQYSNIVTLSIMTPPAKNFPKCDTKPSFSRVGVGDNITLICRSEGGNPPASLTWIRERDILNVKNTPPNKKPINRVSVLLTEQDIDKKYVCIARNPATKQPLSCSVKPLRSSIGVRVEPPSLIADPGTHAAYNCISEVVPDLIFTWYVNNQRVDGTNARYATKRGGKRLKIYPVLPSDDFSSIKCDVNHPTTRYELSGSASALLWVNLDIPWVPTSAPRQTTKVYNRLPDRIFNNIDVTQKPPATDKSFTTIASFETSEPVGIHQHDQGLVDINGNAIDINNLLKTLGDSEPIVPEKEPTLSPPSTKVIKTTTSFPKSTNVKVTPLENRVDNQLCRGDTCKVITTPLSAQATNVSNNPSQTEPSNEIPKLETLPPANPSGTQSSSNGLAIGLPLGLIFLALIVVIIVVVIWKKKWK